MTYSAEVLADLPWGFWEQAETSGTTLADSSGNARSMTITGAPTMNQTGPSPALTAIAWANAVGYANTADSVATSPATIEVWVYLTANPAVATQVFSMANNMGTHDKDMWVDTAGKINFYFYPGYEAVVVASSALALNVWHHVVASVGAAGAKLRIDKVTVGTNAATTSYAGSVQSMFLHLHALNGAGSTSGTAAMTIGAPAVYITQLTDARTDAHYDAGFIAPPPSGPSAQMAIIWDGVRYAKGDALPALSVSQLRHMRARGYANTAAVLVVGKPFTHLATHYSRGDAMPAGLTDVQLRRLIAGRYLV